MLISDYLLLLIWDGELVIVVMQEHYLTQHYDLLFQFFDLVKNRTLCLVSMVKYVCVFWLICSNDVC